MGFYFFGRKKVNKKLLAKNKLDGVSMKVGALITHFGGVLLKGIALMICWAFLQGYLAFLSYSAGELKSPAEQSAAYGGSLQIQLLSR